MKLLVASSIIIILLATLVTSEPTTKEDLKQIINNVYSFTTIQGFPLISMFIVTSQGVIAIEPFNSVHSRQLVTAIRTITQKPIKYLLISHNHWDHARGGKVFSDEGATVIAHQEAADWMEEYPTQDLYIPDRTWRGRKQTLCLGEATVDLHYFGINHGYGMTVFVYKPPQGTQQDNVAYISDLVLPNRVFFASMPDYNTVETIRTLREILKLPFNKAVFSHSNIGDQPDGTTKEVHDKLQYMLDIEAGVKKGIAEGQNLVLNPGLLQLPQYKDLGGFDEFFTLNVAKFVYERFFTGPYPWRSVKKYMKPSKRTFVRRLKNKYNGRYV